MKTFVAEASGSFESALDGLGFSAPEVISERNEYPLMMELRYHRVDVVVQTRLILAYGGEEYVDTALLWADGESTRHLKIGEDKAHTGYQMRRALGRHAQAVSDALRRGHKTLKPSPRAATANAPRLGSLARRPG